MRAASLALAGLALTAFAPPASAAGCVVTAETPTWRHNFGATAAGSFTCDGPRDRLEIDVCLETLGAAGWGTTWCESWTAEDAASVSGTAYGCEYGPTLIRSYVTATASTGEGGDAASLPVPYYCTPL